MRLVQDMLLHQRDQSERNGAAAEARLADAREELLLAEVDLAKAQAEGPASHRKRDYIDKATKEVSANVLTLDQSNPAPVTHQASSNVSTPYRSYEQCRLELFTVVL